MDARDLVNYYNVPSICKECGGVMVFKGVGEYQCEDCHALDWDDYGKVRNYIEKHKGATAAEIEGAIGVPQRTIRRLLKDARIEIADGSKVFMKCEVCGAQIRSGRFCTACEVNVHRNLEAQYREALHAHTKIFGRGESGETGQRRFMRDGKNVD